MQTLELEKYSAVEMSYEELQETDGGRNPIVRWILEQIGGWFVGKALDATVEQASQGGGGGNTHMDSMNAAGDPS